MVTKTITFSYVADDNSGFKIEKMLRTDFLKIVEENGGKGIRIDSEVQFVNHGQEQELKIARFIGK